MIPKKYIDAYKSIKAPETLHDRVTASSASRAERTRTKPRLFTSAASIAATIAASAASIAIIIVAVIALRTGGADTNAYVAYNGQPVENSVAITIDQISIIKPFEIGISNGGGIKLDVYVTDTTTVTVSTGTVILVDENGISTDSVNLLTLSDDKNPHTVYWKADFYKVSENDDFSLVIADAHGSVTYTLTNSNGELTLTKN